jgi:hypothetical protein
MQGGAGASAQCLVLRKLWGRPPGLRGTPPSRSRYNAISILQGASRPTGASAAVPGDRPTIDADDAVKAYVSGIGRFRLPCPLAGALVTAGC